MIFADKKNLILIERPGIPEKNQIIPKIYNGQ